MMWREFRRAMVLLTARISDQSGNVCDDGRVTTPRCIVNEHSGMKSSLKPREVPKDPFAMSTNTAELPIRGHRPDGCHSGRLPAGARRRKRVTLGGLDSFRMPSFIQGWPHNYIASLWTQYSCLCFTITRIIFERTRVSRTMLVVGRGDCVHCITTI